METMVWVLLFFVGASLVLYVVLGGADYGAGILELLPAGRLRERQKEIINHAMGPVWEANHMWLIIVVVILFMGFPAAFNALMVSLHLPMVALLIGIVVRGSVFTFRHYDAIQSPRSQKFYTILFGLSSLWTSLWLGIIAASLFRGRIDLEARTFEAAYVAPWWGLFPVSMGLFVVSIFAFLASVYLIGESRDPEMKKFFSRRGFFWNLAVVLLGAFVFFFSNLEGGDLLLEFSGNFFSLACLLFATLLFAILWLVARRSRKAFWARVVAAGQATLILAGWFALHAPAVLTTTQGDLTFFEAAAPAATLWQLNLALVIGSFFIFPSLFYLLRLFKNQPS